MNLRKRSHNSTDSIKPEVVSIKNIVRRSERIKTDDKINETDPSKTLKKDNMKRIKKKPKRKKTTDTDEMDNSDLDALFPPVVEVSIRDVLEHATSAPGVEGEILNEATLIYECRECKGFFRHLSEFMKHKQTFCPRSMDERPGAWNPFLIKEIFDLLHHSDDDSSDDGACSEEDSAFEDGPSTSSPQVPNELS